MSLPNSDLRAFLSKTKRYPSSSLSLLKERGSKQEIKLAKIFKTEFLVANAHV